MARGEDAKKGEVRAKGRRGDVREARDARRGDGRHWTGEGQRHGRGEKADGKKIDKGM